jgi:hypothetical protein
MGFSIPDLRHLPSSHIKTFLVFVFPLTFLCSQNHLSMMVGKRLSISCSSPCLAYCVFAQVDNVFSPVESSHASKRLKTDVPKPEPYKGKGVATPSNSSKDSSKSMSSHLRLRDYCSHVISAFHPQGPHQLKAIA